MKNENFKKLNFSLVSTDEIIKEINNLKSKKSNGPFLKGGVSYQHEKDNIALIYSK